MPDPTLPDGVRCTLIGGPTVLLELGGLRLLTDPAFDPAGAAFVAGTYRLEKTAGPALPVARLGPIDAVLLSHEHHFDNLDASGRALLPRARRVLTTAAGAARLGGNAAGLAPWDSIELTGSGGRRLRVTATPCRHGPAHADRGPVIGFFLAWADRPDAGVYLSGDTVWYEGVAEVARRLPVRLALLFMGAARVPAVGPWPLTFTALDGVEAARAFADAPIVPVHRDGWAHFSESRVDITAAFAAAGLASRLRWLEPGQPCDLPLRPA